MAKVKDKGKVKYDELCPKCKIDSDKRGHILKGALCPDCKRKFGIGYQPKTGKRGRRKGGRGCKPGKSTGGGRMLEYSKSVKLDPATKKLLKSIKTAHKRADALEEKANAMLAKADRLRAGVEVIKDALADL